MTSKEVLESIRNECYTENGRKIVVIGRDDERFDFVKKDLEILDIFMNNLFVGDDSLSIIMDDLRNFEDFDKVKEWLNEKD